MRRRRVRGGDSRAKFAMGQGRGRGTQYGAVGADGAALELVGAVKVRKRFRVGPKFEIAIWAIASSAHCVSTVVPSQRSGPRLRALAGGLLPWPCVLVLPRHPSGPPLLQRTALRPSALITARPSSSRRSVQCPQSPRPSNVSQPPRPRPTRSPRLAHTATRSGVK